MEVLKINPKRIDRGKLKKLADFVKKGKVVILPTDTVYGLVADATNKKAVERVFQIKRRKRGKPIPIFVRSLEAAKKIAKIDKQQEEFLRMAWPGKVTAILKPRKKLPKGIGKSREEIGLRIPSYKIVSQLLFILNIPLTGTSANVSGKPPSTKIKEVLSQFKGRKFQPDLVADTGNLPESRPSIILDLTVLPPKILRG